MADADTKPAATTTPDKAAIKAAPADHSLPAGAEMATKTATDSVSVVMARGWPLGAAEADQTHKFGSSHDVLASLATKMLRAGAAVRAGSPAAAEIAERVKAANG